LWRNRLERKTGLSFAPQLDGEIVGDMITYIIHGGFGLEKRAWIGGFVLNRSIWEAASEKDW
jgi:hypothetical protein